MNKEPHIITDNFGDNPFGIHRLGFDSPRKARKAAKVLDRKIVDQVANRANLSLLMCATAPQIQINKNDDSRAMRVFSFEEPRVMPRRVTGTKRRHRSFGSRDDSVDLDASNHAYPTRNSLKRKASSASSCSSWSTSCSFSNIIARSSSSSFDGFELSRPQKRRRCTKINDIDEKRELAKRLVELTQSGNLHELKAFIGAERAKIDFDKPVSSGLAAIHIAAQIADADIVQLLTINGANINLKTVDFDGVTPLHIAAALPDNHSQVTEQKKLIQMILNCGGDSAIRDANGTTPLVTAVHHANRTAVEMLLHCGAAVNACSKLLMRPSPSSILCSSTSTESSCSSSSSARSSLFRSSSSLEEGRVARVSGTTALHEAVARGLHRIVDILLDHGAQLLADDSGKTPVCIAAEIGSRRLTLTLLSRRPFPAIPLSRAIRLARLGSHKKVERVLIDHLKARKNLT